MTDSTDRQLAAIDEVEDLLAAYADARLMPAGPVLSRMRAAVVGRAVANADARAEQRRLDTDRAIGRRWALPGFHLPRRAVSLGLAATLMVGGTAAVLAAPPGSALYGTRVAIENAFLPNTADARLAAHEERISEALADAQAAAANGDTAALTVALTAYSDEVDAAIADVGNDPDRLASLEDVLGMHVAVLETLESRLPTQAAIDHAIVASQNALDKLHQSDHDGGKPSQAPHPTAPPHPTHVPTTDGPDQNLGGGNS